ncbi:hypothetical protein M409DRAFT_49024 [Zasmidium cellare ATCC 36951]|uniref:Zn(2)-C6 fungal-type domain-containing protein n=1 Tax=Zasmidium cellare ATCC 36951 TaxID=1080233 RepID=A0A6A6D435_ZASCE|nr:uncharacterized protein M409DRAFT_49024 [Zasmidium cellare ATCC 36951]KAF2174157.1 hypothetical protein M409DRAFT_49024 [Zasmidium cellare ATCC 36951]
MELLTPISPVAFDQRHSIARSSYYSAASTTSSSSPDLTTPTTTVSTALTNHDSDDDDNSSSADSSRQFRIVPKIEELDDEKYINGQLHAVRDAKSPVGIVSSPPPRKKRGRPRKHPIVDASESKKTSHARSKTGCGTCRRRKKKCDETKPSCMNCEKNNVVCDGYEPKQPWRSGKQKAALQVGHLGHSSVPPSIPDMAPGINGDLDRQLIYFFSTKIGERLSLIDESNPFLDLIMPLAMKNVGLMHSVLFFASSCFLASGPGSTDEARARREHHHHLAIQFLNGPHTALEPDNARSATPAQSITAGAELTPVDQPQPGSSALTPTSKPGSPSIPIALAQALILCLETVASGSLDSDYRVHLGAMKDMLIQQRDNFADQKLRTFILEFLLYHDFSSSITNIEPTTDDRSLELMKDFDPPQYMVSPAAGSLLGVMDGLFGLMSRIRHLRDTIRAKKTVRPGFCWLSHPEVQVETYRIDDEIRKWECRYVPESPRFKTSLLYRQCVWVYLWRTVFPSEPHPALKTAVDGGLKLLNELPSGDIDDVGGTQSVLLMPVFLLGCAAFEQEQRRHITEAFYRLKTWSRLGNISRAEEVVRDVWELMDQGREQESWDWENVIARRGWDLLIT